MKNQLLLLFLVFFAGMACESKDEENPNSLEGSMYFPPTTGSDWENTSISSLGWNESQVPALLDFLESKNSKSFLILVNDRIVMEEYFD
jgi:hypothetical protein